MFLNTASKLGQVAVSLPSQTFHISTDGDCIVSSAKPFSLWKTFPSCPAFPVAVCARCLLPSCYTALKAARSFSIHPLWHGSLHPLWVAGSPIWDAVCLLVDERSSHSKDLGVKWMRQEECAELHWKRHWQLLLCQDKEGIFSNFFLCVSSFSPRQPGRFPTLLHHLQSWRLQLCCATRPTLAMSSSVLFLPFLGSLAFTQEISLKHQEAC